VGNFDLSVKLAESLHGGSSLLPLLLTLLAGFLSALSPCVYPLIPITLSVMGARRYDSRLQGFLVAGAYVFGMSLIYSVLGALFAYLGLVVGSLMQSPAMLLIIASVFLLMALSMFGAINLVLPSRIMDKLGALGGQGIKGAFLMGLVAGLIAAPCTGPVLGFILTLIATEQNIALGLALMFSFSLGMGFPFLILGTFSSLITRLPKSGAWMDRIKFILGALMIGAAIYYAALASTGLSKILTVFGQMGSLALVVNLLLGAILLVAQAPFAQRAFSQLAPKIIGAALVALSLAALLNSSEEPAPQVLESELAWHVIDHKSGPKAFDAFLIDAKKSGSKVMIDFYADWCVACRKLSSITFKDPEVLAALRNYYLIKVDASSGSENVANIEQRFHVTGLPTLVFLDEAGLYLHQSTILGFVEPKVFLKRLAD
jgi:thiol:disulfide interchange protein DsbD